MIKSLEKTAGIIKSNQHESFRGKIDLLYEKKL